MIDRIHFLEFMQDYRHDYLKGIDLYSTQYLYSNTAVARADMIRIYRGTIIYE